MSRWMGVLGLLGLAYIGAMAPVQAGEAPTGWDYSHKGNMQLAGLNFTDETGQGHMLSEFRGKAILLNFWATWCGPCVAEMPGISSLKSQFGADGFEVVAVSQDVKIDAVKNFFAMNTISNLGIYQDKNSAAMRSLKLRGLPTTILLDKNLSEIARSNGPISATDPVLLEMIKQATLGQ